jgi:hypothetical protein
MFHFTCVLKVNEHNFNCLVLYHTERVRERQTKNMKNVMKQQYTNRWPTGTITCIGKSVLSYTILNSKRKGVNENDKDSPTNNGERISLYLHLHVVYLNTVPDLPLCLGVLKHRAPLARERGGGGGGPIFLPKCFFNNGFLLMWCNLKLEGVLFRSDSRHNDRVDSLWECATKQAVITVAQ